MNFLKLLGEGMLLGARAHAQWEIDVSNRVFGDRRRLLLLMLFVLPAVVGGFAFADQVASALPGIIGGKTRLQPGLLHHNDLRGLDRGRRRGRPDHRLHRRGRRLHHRPGADERRGQGHPGGRHRPLPHLRQGDHGQRLHRKLGNISVALAVVFLIGSIGGATLGRLHQPGRSTRSTRSSAMPSSPPSMSFMLGLPRLLRADSTTSRPRKARREPTPRAGRTTAASRRHGHGQAARASSRPSTSRP